MGFRWSGFRYDGLAFFCDCLDSPCGSGLCLVLLAEAGVSVRREGSVRARSCEGTSTAVFSVMWQLRDIPLSMLVFPFRRLQKLASMSLS